MGYNCISCGRELKGVYCKGKINNIVVTFCYEDSKFCENCEKITCYDLNLTKNEDIKQKTN